MIRTTAVAVLLSVSVLTGCGGGADESATKDTPSATPTDPRDKFADSPEGQDYLDTLATVNPELRANRAIGWGESLCDDFESGSVEPGNALERVRLRYAGGDRPELTDDEAKVILDAAVRNICPGAAK